MHRHHDLLQSIMGKIQSSLKQRSKKSKGAAIRIFGANHRSSVIWSLIPILLKSTFYHELNQDFLQKFIQGLNFFFENCGIPLLGDSWGDFLIWWVEGALFQKYTIISPLMFNNTVHFCFFLVLQWGNCWTIAYTQQKPDFGAALKKSESHEI